MAFQFPVWPGRKLRNTLRLNSILWTDRGENSGKDKISNWKYYKTQMKSGFGDFTEENIWMRVQNWQMIKFKRCLVFNKYKNDKTKGSIPESRGTPDLFQGGMNMYNIYSCKTKFCWKHLFFTRIITKNMIVYQYRSLWEFVLRDFLS